MIIKELLTKWGFVVDDKDIAGADKKVEKLNASLKKTFDGAEQLGKKLSLFVTLPILGLGAAMIKAASDAEETESKFNVVFSSLAKQSSDAARTLARDFGLSRTAAKELLGDTGDLLTGFGFSQKSALDLSNQVQKLAVDLASFTNFSGGAQGASRALTKALLGERESIKSLGISILEEDVKRRVALNTSKGMTFATERQAKAFATLTLAQEQSKNAIGDFARTSQGFANQMRIARSRLGDVAEGFGKLLLPVANKIVKAGVRVLNFFDDLNVGTKKIILVLAAIAAAIGPVIFLFGLMGNGMLSLIFFANALNVSLLGLAGKFILLPLLILGVLIAMEDLLAFVQGKKSVFGLFVKEFGESFKKLSGIKRFLISEIVRPIREVIGTIEALIGVIGSLGEGDFKGAFDAIKKGIDKIFLPAMDITFDKLGFTGLDFRDLGALFGREEGVKPPEGGGSPKQALPESNLSRFLGLGGQPTQSQALTRPALPATATKTQSNQNNINITVDSPINVPPGTPPEAVNGAVKDGVKEALDNIFRDTQLATEPRVAF